MTYLCLSEGNYMKKIILTFALLFISSCTMYHKEHGRVGVMNIKLQKDAIDCEYEIKKEKKYKNFSKYNDLLGICMVEKGWRP